MKGGLPCLNLRNQFVEATEFVAESEIQLVVIFNRIFQTGILFHLISLVPFLTFSLYHYLGNSLDVEQVWVSKSPVFDYLFCCFVGVDAVIFLQLLYD